MTKMVRGPLWLRVPFGTLVPLFAIALRLGSADTAGLSYFVIALYSLRGRVEVIQALALSWFFSMVSSGIAPVAPSASLGRYAVLFCAAASILWRSKIRLRLVTLMTLALGGFFVLHALVVSPIVDVSVLKAVSWTLAMTTLMAAWVGLTVDMRVHLVKQLFDGLTALMVLSLPLLALPVGYLGAGFQGVLGHPQVFGPTMALLGAWTASQILGQSLPSWSSVALLAACLVLIVLSGARTAGLALVLGVGAAVISVSFVSGRTLRSRLPGLRSRRFQLVALLVLLGSMSALPILHEVVTNFISKGDRANATGVMDAYQQSRGNMMAMMLENIDENPWVGIGFGIASDAASMEISRDPVLGLPTGASTEKGVLVLAVLEEVGVFGLLLTSAWIWMLLRRSAAGGIAPLAVALTVLFGNMGESTLFSPSGFGLLTLVLLSWAFASGQAEARSHR